MHKISALFLFILLMGLTGCEDKKQDDAPIPIENTTEIFEKNNTNQQNITKRKSTKEASTFTLLNTKSQSHNVTVSGQEVILDQKKHAIVILHFFATWCQPCIGEIAYMNDLQKKYQKNVFIAGILTHDTIDQNALETFIIQNHINYFISNSTQNDTFATLLADTLGLPENFSIPLIVMYANGKYFTHYEGSVPVEMIEYDIEQAKKQLKSR